MGKLWEEEERAAHVPQEAPPWRRFSDAPSGHLLQSAGCTQRGRCRGKDWKQNQCLLGSSLPGHPRTPGPRSLPPPQPPARPREHRSPSPWLRCIPSTRDFVRATGASKSWKPRSHFSNTKVVDGVWAREIVRARPFASVRLIGGFSANTFSPK